MASVSMGNPAQPEAIVDDAAADQKAWDHYRRVDLLAENGTVPVNPAPMPAKPSDPVGAARHDLVLANRILADESVGILDTSGHVSLRNPSNPNSYFVATAAPGSVTDKDIIERDVTKPGPDTMGLSIDDEIYKANPNVMAVLYARTPEIVAFTQGRAAASRRQRRRLHRRWTSGLQHLDAGSEAAPAVEPGVWQRRRGCARHEAGRASVGTRLRDDGQVHLQRRRQLVSAASERENPAAGAWRCGEE